MLAIPHDLRDLSSLPGAEPVLPAVEAQNRNYWATGESGACLVVSDSATPWPTQSMGSSRPQYWSGQPFPSPEDLPIPGIEPRSPTLQVDSLPAEPQGTPREFPIMHI